MPVVNTSICSAIPKLVAPREAAFLHLCHRRGVDVRVQDAFHLARRCIPDVTALAEHERIQIAGHEVVDPAVLHRRAPHFFIGAVKVVCDFLKVCHRQTFEIFEGLWQRHAIFFLERCPLSVIVQHVLTDEQRDRIAFLRQAPNFLRTIWIGHIGVDDSL